MLKLNYLARFRVLPEQTAKRLKIRQALIRLAERLNNAKRNIGVKPFRLDDGAAKSVQQLLPYRIWRCNFEAQQLQKVL